MAYKNYDSDVHFGQWHLPIPNSKCHGKTSFVSYMSRCGYDVLPCWLNTSMKCDYFAKSLLELEMFEALNTCGGMHLLVEQVGTF
jgi:hypothetical protein